MISYWGVEHGDVISKMRQQKPYDQHRTPITRPMTFNSRAQNSAVGGGLGAALGASSFLGGGGRAVAAGAVGGGLIGGAAGAAMKHKNSPHAGAERKAYLGGQKNYNAHAVRVNNLKASKKNKEISRADFKRGRQASQNQALAANLRVANRYVAAHGSDALKDYDVGRKRKS